MKKLIILLLFVSFYCSPKAQNTPCPCCAPEFRQFDFWLGEWETLNLQQDNTLAGTNRIVLMQDSCVIQENWISANAGYTGTSYNWYDPQDRQWHQSWIDNQGGSLRLSGGLKDGKMVLYSGEMKNQQGQSYVNRITWTPNADSTVRQHWEVSSDKGKTWTTVFDGLYKRK